ncbi:MAG: response regulator [Nitrospiraceae bacterium]|nr:MAG: response regulator [Nitrospiraceae bacterium]
MESLYSILIVEDDKGISGLYQKILQRAGYITESVFMGSDAISKALKDEHFLMLLDYDLPDMNGFKLSRL